VAQATMILGGLLIVLGIAGFVMTGSEHYTALIPAAFGLLFMVLGGLALKPSARKHAMHAAAALGLLGFAGTVPGIIKLVKWGAGTVPDRPAAVVSQSVMALLTIAFVALCVRSFIHARRSMTSPS
jgi:membrane-bound ClpP family serine protease